MKQRMTRCDIWYGGKQTADSCWSAKWLQGDTVDKIHWGKYRDCFIPVIINVICKGNWNSVQFYCMPFWTSGRFRIGTVQEMYRQNLNHIKPIIRLLCISNYTNPNRNQNPLSLNQFRWNQSHLLFDMIVISPIRSHANCICQFGSNMHRQTINYIDPMACTTFRVI